MRLTCLVVLLGTLTAPVLGHEFWIDPQKYQVETGAPVRADLRNGQEFKGVALAYFPRDFTRFELAMGDILRPVEGRMGDIPALDVTGAKDGLLIILHETTPSTLTYRKWEKFQRFADHKDFPDIRARHDARGLPEERFKERYTRHAKALVAIGDGQGSDRAFGLATEFVALDNPYDGEMSEMTVRLLYQGATRADAQVEMFERAPDGAVAITLHRTDAEGTATVPVKAGHAYLLDAVVLRETTGEDGAVWETLWAALTFAVP